MGLHVSLVDAPHLRLGQSQGQHLLDVGDVHALLQGADHDEVGHMDPGVLLLHRRRHDLQPHVVVDDAGGDGGVAVLVLGQEVQIPLQQHDHLIHIQVHVRQLVPLGQMKILEIVLPSAELGADEVHVVSHDPFSSFVAFSILLLCGLDKRQHKNDK